MSPFWLGIAVCSWRFSDLEKQLPFVTQCGPSARNTQCFNDQSSLRRCWERLVSEPIFGRVALEDLKASNSKSRSRRVNSRSYGFSA